MAVSTKAIGVLVTRPAGQAGPLCRRIEALGWQAITFPTIEIVPVAETTLWNRSDFDILIFVSRNAVIYGSPQIQGDNGSVQFAAVGKGTADELKKQGITIDVVPEARWDSEGLLEHPALGEVEGKRVLIVRGEGGRGLLADELSKRGAIVEYAEVYRRSLPKADAASLIQNWSEKIDLVTTTSNEILQNLITMLAEDGLPLLRKTPLMVVSERGKVLAASFGCERIILANSATEDGLVSAMLQWAESANL